ncbi:uncharacterized protein TEOVI_000225800 [Trypanosoma equiperdum]|uniref:T. brucei spp.-specific protein n=2 Tax=Trypanozoon TaxID=39700 RepID=Q4GYL8_TRYB2|nr:hypothetical protein TB927.1.3550 [Trypanosoma brucei brucei TREU927]CAJ16566.1 hypothetical protein TB927.1.3550 [Trypanosoma brucei brucei TREU927]SCU70684.1 hypothetical protein, conserved [Trypanosoma equiperdum]
MGVGFQSKKLQNFCHSGAGEMCALENCIPRWGSFPCNAPGLTPVYELSSFENVELPLIFQKSNIGDLLASTSDSVGQLNGFQARHSNTEGIKSQVSYTSVALSTTNRENLFGWVDCAALPLCSSSTAGASILLVTLLTRESRGKSCMCILDDLVCQLSNGPFNWGCGGDCHDLISISLPSEPRNHAACPIILPIAKLSRKEIWLREAAPKMDVETIIYEGDNQQHLVDDVANGTNAGSCAVMEAGCRPETALGPENVKYGDNESVTQCEVTVDITPSTEPSARCLHFSECTTPVSSNRSFMEPIPLSNMESKALRCRKFDGTSYEVLRRRAHSDALSLILKKYSEHLERVSQTSGRRGLDAHC